MGETDHTGAGLLENELLANMRRSVSDLALSIPALDANRAGIALYGATDFSAFEIFSPNENTLSRVIAELFDPTGSHGQGLLFLNGMLKAINVPPVNRREAVRSRREVRTREGRRIDIVIETPRYVIGIENKPWAAQQHKQLQDYIDELSSDLRGRVPVLVFLSDQLEESGHGQVVRVPYYSWDETPSLHGVLNAVFHDIKAVGPKSFVSDFIGYINNHFGDPHMTVPSDTPYIHAVEAEFAEPHNRKALAAFLMSASTLHWVILGEVADYILSTVKREVASDFEVSTDWSVGDCLAARYVPWGVRRPSWPANCQVAIESQKPGFDEIKFGLKAPDIRKIGSDAPIHGSSARPLLEKLPGEVAGGKKTPYWAWEQPLWDPYWGAELAARLVIHSPTGMVSDHPEVQELGRKFVELAQAADRLLAA